ncbi:MAG: YeeE/YedE family protein [Candidatus Solibacter usitatus]|nr:YeeE/YedE family protein [Candidatus Solibacter usitatus]
MQSFTEVFAAPWPWYVAGPVIGLFVPALLIAGNKMFGVSGNLRHLCSALLSGQVEHFRYDWKRAGLWNLLFVAGAGLGGYLASNPGGTQDIQISEQTRLALMNLGIHDFSGLAPREVFSWTALFTLKGFASVVLGGFLVGFGTAYAGGCTSGHAISGLADLQLPSLVAVVGFFAGGLIATYFILPMVL